MISSLSTYKEIRRRATEKCIPLNALFELTYKCNLSCIHCYLPCSVKESNQEELQFDKITNILDQLKEAGTLFLTLSGGEPLIREDFFDIANYARKNKFAVRIFTNGTLIDEKIARRIKEVNPLIVEISLYGINPQTYEKITNTPGSFEKVMKGITLLHELKVPIFIKTSVMKYNHQEIWEIEKFAIKLGVKFNCGPTITPSINSGTEPLHCRASDRQLEDFFQKYLGRTDSKLEPNPEKINDSYICNTARSNAAINPYGELSPCVEIRLKNCDLKQRSFNDLWENSLEMRKFRSINWSGSPECKKCELLPHCFKCPGITLSEEGNISSCLKESRRHAKIKKDIYEKITEVNHNV